MKNGVTYFSEQTGLYISEDNWPLFFIGDKLKFEGKTTIFPSKYVRDKNNFTVEKPCR